MQVLITGGAGFIGLHLANRLLASGFSVCIVDNLSRGVADEDLQHFLDRPSSSFQEIDLLDPKEVLELGNNFNIVVHLAAIIGVKNVNDRPYAVLTQNVESLKNVIRLSERQKNLQRFLFASTSEVYAGTLKHYHLPIPTPEEVPLTLNPLSESRTTYMLSKLYGEAMCQQSGLPVTIFRPHNIYGPRMGMAHVIPEQMKNIWLARPEDNLKVFSTMHTRAFCYIKDAVAMLEEMMTTEACLGQTLNLGCEAPEISIRELVEACLKITCSDLQIVAEPPTTGSPERRAPDMSATYLLLRTRPKITLHEGLRRTWEWYSENIFSSYDE